MASRIERKTITIIDPNAGDEVALLRHGKTVIDLRKVQAAIDGRRNNELSWMALTKAIGDSTVISKKKADWRQLVCQLRQPFAAAQEKAEEALTNQEKASLSTGAPLQGLAEVVIQHFDPDNAHPEFQEVLRNAESYSLVRGEALKATIARNADRVATAGDDEDAALEAVSAHAEAIDAMRAEEAALRTAKQEAAGRRLGATFVRSGGETHHRAHEAGRALGIGGGTDGPYSSVLRLVAEARREKGWSHPAQSDAPDGWTR